MADDRHLFVSLRAYLRPGMHALDIGAHAARVTNVMVEGVGPSGRVVAVEPDPLSAALLQRNPAFTTVQAAVGAVEASARDLWVCESDRRQNALVRAAVNGSGKVSCIRVPAVTVDGLVAQYLDGRVDALKVDAQGSDLEVLEGARQTLAGPGPGWIAVEAWPHGLRQSGQTVGALCALLEDAGYVPERMSWTEARALVEGLDRAGSGYTDLVCVKRGA